MQKLVAWFKGQGLRSGLLALSVFVGALAVILGQQLGCSLKPPTPAQTAKAEADFCKARAAYKVVALAAAGALDPAPGSARAKLEAAEDVFCAGLK